MGYYNVGRRSKNWWKSVFSYLIEVCILNAHNLHKFSNQPQVDFLQFSLNLATQLIGTMKKSSRGRTQSVDRTKLLRLDNSKGHLPGVAPRCRCAVCCKVREKRDLTKHEYRHESCIKCSVCEVHLCLNEKRNCYKLYHTELEYLK